MPAHAYWLFNLYCRRLCRADSIPHDVLLSVLALLDYPYYRSAMVQKTRDVGALFLLQLRSSDLPRRLCSFHLAPPRFPGRLCALSRSPLPRCAFKRLSSLGHRVLS
jgi:hypothetical protein